MSALTRLALGAVLLCGCEEGGWRPKPGTTAYEDPDESQITIRCAAESDVWSRAAAGAVANGYVGGNASHEADRVVRLWRKRWSCERAQHPMRCTCEAAK